MEDEDNESMFDAAHRIQGTIGSLPGGSHMEKLRYYEVALLERQVRAATQISSNLEVIANALGSK